MKTFFIVFVLGIQKKKSINITIGLQCDFVLKAKEDCWVIDFVSISWCPDRINVKEKLFLQLSWISSKRPESASKIFCGFFPQREEVMTFLGPRTPPPSHFEPLWWVTQTPGAFNNIMTSDLRLFLKKNWLWACLKKKPFFSALWAHKSQPENISQSGLFDLKFWLLAWNWLSFKTTVTE